MPPIVAIVQMTSSFEQIWEPLIRSAGASPRFIQWPRLARIDAEHPIIVAAGGAESEAVTALRTIRERAPRSQIAVVGGLREHRVALDLVHAGAEEYFALPGDTEMMASWLVLRVQTVSASATLDMPRHPKCDYSRIIGRSESLRRTLDLTSRVTGFGDATVLITGETGVGKELIAHAIHYNGSRARQNLVEVNCSALPANLVEAELFGHEAGAFTDARIAKPGLFEVAARGTLFLDEVGELALDVQAKLLRALDEKRTRRLGATDSVAVDARIIAATHVDLGSAVQAGRFRQDLYYRLNVLRIHVPPLRERPDDILILAEHFAERLRERHGLPRWKLDESMRKLLLAHSWPGNVRELRNAIERAMLLGESCLIGDEARHDIMDRSGSLPFPADMESIQQAAARAMVERHRGNKSAAASALAISRKRLYALLQSATPPNPRPVQRSSSRLPSFVQERAVPRLASANSLRSALWGHAIFSAACSDLLSRDS